MSNPSNFYAEKILAQHPLAMWSLDDESYYLTKISEADRDISSWTKINATATTATDPSAPFSSSYITQVTGTATPTWTTEGQSFLSSTSSLTSNGFTISFYLKTQYITNVSAGFGTGETASVLNIFWNASYLTYETSSNHGFSTGDYVQVTGSSAGGESIYDTSGIITKINDTNFRISSSVSNYGNGTGGIAIKAKTESQFINPADYPTNSWIPVSFTFNDNVSNQKILLGFTYSQTSPDFFINGLTVGKDSQPFNGESLGQTSVTIPTNIATTLTNAIEANSYGTQEYKAYYISDATSIYSKNSGVSMCYGSDTSMRVYPYTTSGQPSFIFPGFGMLNEIGRYKTISLQALVRIAANNSTPKRIIGPIASNDGVYVTKDIISLKIGDNIGSFPLSEMYRPMVMQIKIGNGFAKLSIDGEELISLQIDNSSLSLPAKLSGSSKNQDWLGIYAYTDIPLIEVGSLAIFPYEISDTLGKLNLAYAQSVEIPSISNSSSGQTISPDFALSNYVNNYNYPSFQAKWEQATISENLDVLENGALSTKQYTKPAITTSLYDSSRMLLDIYETYVASAEPNTFINLKPSSVVSGSGRSWTTNQGYLSFNLYGENDYLSSCVYGVFKSLESSGTEQILLRIKNTLNENYFQVSIINTTVYYKYRYDSVSETQITTKSITQNTIFAIGFDIQKLIQSDSNLFNFFSNKTNLQVFVGGQEGLTNTFSGNIYKVGFCSTRNAVDISALFDATGILTNASSYSSLLSKTASYTLYGLNAFGKINLDAGTTGYWQDYVPLSKLAKTTINASGQEAIALDLIQINLDYEEPRTYSSGNFVTSSLPIRGYVTFQTLSSGANQDLTSFVTTQSASASRMIDASTFSATTKYEFVNGMVINPPTNVDLSTLAIVVHLDLLTDSSNIKPARLRFLQLAAQSFNKNMPNKLGTKYALDVYPYTYNLGSTVPTRPYDYNSKNEYLVYKQSTPHLYLTRHSGYRIVGTLPTDDTHRGLYANLGDFSPDKKITSIQMSILADFESFSGSSNRVFSIKTNSGEMIFRTGEVPGDTSKATISTTSSIPVTYYLNGRKVGKPVIAVNEWNVLGISFAEPLDVSNTQGRIFISSKLLITDISCHYANPIELDQKSEPILWSNVGGNIINIQTPTGTTNIAITTGTAHGFSVGQQVTIKDVIPLGYNGTWTTQTGTTGTTLVVNIGSNPGAITSPGTVLGIKWRIPVPVQTPTRVGNAITLTTTGNHNLVVGERLTFYDIIPDGYRTGFAGASLKVLQVNTNSSFTYVNSNAPTTAITTAGTVAGTWQYARIPNYYALYGGSPDSIYDQFTGRNKIIIDTYSDSPVMQLNEYQYLAYMDIETKTFTLDIK